MIDEAKQQIKSQCKRDAKFQDAKHKEHQRSHDILNDPDLTRDEKWVALVAIGFGKQRAREMVNKL